MFQKGEGVKEVLIPEEEDAPAAARYPQAEVGMSNVWQKSSSSAANKSASVPLGKNARKHFIQ